MAEDNKDTVLDGQEPGGGTEGVFLLVDSFQ